MYYIYNSKKEETKPKVEPTKPKVVPKPTPKPTGELRLRDYQEEAIERWKKWGRKGVIILPTGAGKTFCALALLKEYLSQGKKCVVIVHTKVLLRQWCERIKQWVGVEPGVLYGERKTPDRITVAIINTFQKYPIKDADLYIWDECHHYCTENCLSIIEELRDKDHLGLTATLERSDGNHKMLLRYMPIVYRMRFREAVGRFISRFEIVEIPCELTPWEWQEYVSAEEEIRYYRLRYSSEEINEDPVLRAKYYSRIHKRKAICSAAKDKVVKLVEILKKVGSERVLVFSESVASIQYIKKVLAENGIKAMCYHSYLKKREREAVLKEWGKSFNVLLTVRCLDEGIDIPAVRYAVILCNSLQKRQVIQRIGRTLRKRSDNTEAKIYLLYCRKTYEERVKLLIRRILAEETYLR